MCAVSTVQSRCTVFELKRSRRILEKVEKMLEQTDPKYLHLKHNSTASVNYVIFHILLVKGKLVLCYTCSTIVNIRACLLVEDTFCNTMEKRCFVFIRLSYKHVLRTF